MDLDRLEALALKATPGPWWERGAVHIVPESMSEAGMRVHTVSVPHDSGQRWDEIFAYVRSDAAYIAAANPQTVLALIKRLRDAEGGQCRTCTAPLGVIGCDGCDAAICACCVAGHECVTDTGPGEGE